MSPSSVLIDLVQAASLFVLGVVGLVLLGDRLSRKPLLRSLAIGGCFTASALLSMADPVVWRPGFTFDGRFIGILLAGPVGGIPSVLLVGAACAGMRLYQGGAGVPAALTSIALTSMLSIGWCLYGRRFRRMLDHRWLVVIGLSSAVPLLVAAGALPSWMSLGERASIVGLVASFNAVGVQLIGALLVWERERRDAVAALRGSEARLAAIAGNVPGAIYRRRRSAAGVYSFDFVSDGALDLLGLAPAAMVHDARAIEALLDPCDRSRLRTALDRSAATLQPFSLETVVHRPDGRAVWVTSRSTPRREPSGDTVWEGIMLDVSERVALERAAREANAAKSRFLAFVTHELRSPLNAIVGYCDLAAMSPLFTRPDPARSDGSLSALHSYIETIHHAAEHLAAMTDDLLDLGKTEAGKLDLHQASVDLPALAARVVDLLRHQGEAKAVRLEAAITPDTTVRADPRRLQQILLNLVGNAVKYSRSGGRVRIAASRDDDHDLISIEDTGIGMSDAQIAVAFEAYGQVDNRENRVVAGTGLGLPLVKRLVSLHGGTVEIESAPGSGTVVTVRLPRRAAAVLSEAA